MRPISVCQSVGGHDSRARSVRKRLNRSICRMRCRLVAAQGTSATIVEHAGPTFLGQPVRFSFSVASQCRIITNYYRASYAYEVDCRTDVALRSMVCVCVFGTYRRVLQQRPRRSRRRARCDLAMRSARSGDAALCQITLTTC